MMQNGVTDTRTQPFIVKDGHSTQTRLVIALNTNKPLSVCIQNTVSQRNTPRCVRTLTLCRVTIFQTTMFGCWLTPD